LPDGSEVSEKVETLAIAIARTEGWGVVGSIPNRYRNPGDLRSMNRHAYPGQIGLNKKGYVIFKTNAWGWAALEKQIQLVIDGKSTRYTQEMTFAQIAKVYAESPQWPKTLCKILQISPRTTFAEYMGLAPRVKFAVSEPPDFIWEGQWNYSATSSQASLLKASPLRTSLI
jgi:hypothetical protein